MKRSVLLVLALSLACTFVGGSAQSSMRGGVDPVIVGPGQQYGAWATSNSLVWQTYDRKHGEHVYFKLFGGRKVRVDRTGSYGTAGSFSDGRHIIYQEFRPRPHRTDTSDLYTYDTRTGARRLIGSPVSTPAWEYWPVANDGTILFGRCHMRPGKDECQNGSRSLLLFQPQAPHPMRVLVRNFSNNIFIRPGFVGSRYVAWTQCGKGPCEVRYYDMDLRQMHAVATAERDQYGPAIDEANNALYFVRGHTGVCGVQVTIRKMDLGSTVSRPVLSLPPGVDTGWTSSLAPAANDHLDLYFTRVPTSRNCDAQSVDVYAIRQVDTL